MTPRQIILTARRRFSIYRRATARLAWTQ